MKLKSLLDPELYPMYGFIVIAMGIMAYMLSTWPKMPVAEPDTYPLTYHGVELNISGNTCTVSAEKFEFEIHVKRGKLKKAKAIWIPSKKTIVLGADHLMLQVIAHEVSHAVDTMLLNYPNEGNHLEAYAQGWFTECVYEIATELYKK